MKKHKNLIIFALVYVALLLIDGFLKYDTNTICVGMVQGVLLGVVYKELVEGKHE